MNYLLNVYKKAFDFKGRSRRKEYWYFVLYFTITYYVLMMLDFLLIFNEISNFIYLTLLFLLFNLVPLLSVSVRRMHDTGNSGFMMLVPIYNLILYFTDSQNGPNEYGPNPKQPGFQTEDHFINT